METAAPLPSRFAAHRRSYWQVPRTPEPPGDVSVCRRRGRRSVARTALELATRPARQNCWSASEQRAHARWCRRSTMAILPASVRGDVLRLHHAFVPVYDPRSGTSSTSAGAVPQLQSVDIGCLAPRSADRDLPPVCSLMVFMKRSMLSAGSCCQVVFGGRSDLQPPRPGNAAGHGYRRDPPGPRYPAPEDLRPRTAARELSRWRAHPPARTGRRAQPPVALGHLQLCGRMIAALLAMAPLPVRVR